MLVKLRSTGQLGNIPDDKFDPNLFEMVQSAGGQTAASQPIVPTQAPRINYETTSTGGGIGDFLLGLGKAVISPVRYATGGLVQAPVAAATGGKVNTYDIPLIGGLLGLSNKELQAMTSNGLDMDKKKVAERYTKEAIKAGATLAAPGMKVGGGLAATLPKAGFTYGALTGGAQALGADQVTPENLVTSALFGGVLGKGLSMLPGASKAADLAETDARQAAYMTRAGTDIFTGEVRDAQVGVAKKYLSDVLNSPKKMQRELPNVLSDINLDIKSRLDDTVPLVDAKKTFKETLLDQLESASDTPRGMRGEIKDVETRIFSLLGKNPTEKSVYDAKSFLTQILKPAYKKQANGTALTKVEEVRMAAHDALTKIIDTFGDGKIRELNMDQNLLYKLSRGLEMSVNKERPYSLMGLTPPVNARGLELSLLDKVAKTQGAISKATQPFEGVSPEMMTRLGGVLGGQLGSGVMPTTPSSPLPTYDQLQASGMSSQEPDALGLGSISEKVKMGQQDLVSQSNLINSDQMARILASPAISTATKDRYKQIYEMQQKEGKSALGTAQMQNKKKQLETSHKLLTELYDRWQKSNASRGNVSGTMSKALTITQRDPKLNEYLDLRKTARSTIARTLGEVGNLSEPEQIAVENAIPDVTDTPEIAIGKWKYLFSMFGE